MPLQSDVVIIALNRNNMTVIFQRNIEISRDHSIVITRSTIYKLLLTIEKISI